MFDISAFCLLARNREGRMQANCLLSDAQLSAAVGVDPRISVYEPFELITDELEMIESQMQLCRMSVRLPVASWMEPFERLTTCQIPKLIRSPTASGKRW